MKGAKNRTTRINLESWETVNQFIFAHRMVHVIVGVRGRLNFNNQAR